MTEPKLNFQTWICPICCDDHARPRGSDILCKIIDLKDMREELNHFKNGKNITEIHYDEPVDLIMENQKLQKGNEILIDALKSMLNFEHHEDCESHLSLDEKDMEDDCDCFLGIAREALRQVGVE